VEVGVICNLAHCLTLKLKKIMNRVIMLLFVVMTTISVNAQKYYRCTGNNVNIRKGPGKNYAIEEAAMILRYGNGGKAQLFKGDIVKYLGKRKNGFMYVEVWGYAGDGYKNADNYWVDSRYFTPATLCPKCKGKGRFVKRCQNDYHRQIDFGSYYHCPSCTCERCSGDGWI
jgi:hypothetical protein